MSRAVDPFRALLPAAILWCALATPAARAWLEAGMASHMLVQLPLLAWIGWSIAGAWMRTRAGGAAARALAGMQSFNAGGVTGLITATCVMVVWMLPRFLDLARLDALVDALKLISVPVAGLAVALSWRRLPAIARAVVHLEVIATLLRFGWGYLAAEERLCLAYLAEEQRLTGELLLALGAAYAVVVVWRPMFGDIGAGRTEMHRRGS
jgi:hypothetical protein